MSKLTDWLDRLRWLFISQFVVALLIFSYFTLAPSPALGQVSNDKIWHFLGSALFYLSARLAFYRLHKVWFVLGFVLIYSACTELAQTLVPGRFFDLRDMTANALGAFSGFVLALAVQWIYGYMQPKSEIIRK